MPRVTVAKVKRFPTPADKLATCYVGRKAWGWPHTPWANPFTAEVFCPAGTPRNRKDAAKQAALGDCLYRFGVHAASQPDSWWADLWAACGQGRWPLGCWCASGHADDLQRVCHAAILGAELNRRFVDLPTPKE